MQTRFQVLAELCEKVEATSKRTVMINLVADFLNQLGAAEVEPAVSMLLGRAFPKWGQRVLEISWATLSNVIKSLTDVNWTSFRESLAKTGDIGAATRILFESSRIRKQATLVEKPLTVLEVRRALEAIAENVGSSSRERKERLLETLFSQASALEAKYLVKIVIGEMRIGFHEGLMELAVSKSFSIQLDVVQTAAMLVGDIAEVAKIAKEHGEAGVLKLELRMFRPFRPMLAQNCESVDEVLQEHGGESAFEYKLDGARIQIHKQADDVRIFSRRLTDVTESLPEIVELIRGEVSAGKAVLEGEVVAVGEDRSPMLFQHLMRRFRRIHKIDEMQRQIPIEPYLFDILYLDGKSLIGLPYVERRKKLAEISGDISLAKQLITKSTEEAMRFLEEAIEAGHEGLMAKRLDSAYTPGVRGKRWLKIKRTLEPLDLVIVGAEWGYGRRHDWLSDYYLAARDAETGEFLVVGKTFKGLTDKEFVQITERLKELTVEKKRHGVKVVPKIVVQVAYNEIQKSPKYECGMALRFARITRFREDKSPEEADTIQRVREIYERQYEKKARY
ncbi:MAG: ATP-dependent DNA ligase [Candidatus Bathyarchaeota archaeon]